MNRPKVSVVMPTYNRAELIGDSLESVFSQTVAPSQVIVVNDGSTDQTREVLEPYLSRIEYLEQPNGGRARALNTGFARVTGDYIWTFDDDDIAFPDLLERHLKVLEANPTLGFTYSGHIRVRSRTGEKAFEVVGPQDIPDDIPEEDLLLRLMENAFMNNQGMVVRTSCYRQVGPFDPELVRGQDYEMGLRLVRSFRCARVPGPTFYYRLGGEVRGSKTPLRVIYQRSRKYFHKIILEVRRSFPLADYLPRSFNGHSPESLDERRALFQRMVVMASHDLMKEMIEDLRLALAHGPDRPLTDAERTVIWEVMGIPSRYGGLFGGPKYLRKVRALCCGSVGGQVQLELGRALFWRFKGALKARDYAFALQIMRCARCLLGIRKAVSFIMQELGIRASILSRRRN